MERSEDQAKGTPWAGAVPYWKMAQALWEVAGIQPTNVSIKKILLQDMLLILTTN